MRKLMRPRCGFVVLVVSLGRAKGVTLFLEDDDVFVRIRPGALFYSRSGSENNK